MRPALFKFKGISQKQRMLLNWWTDTSPVKDATGIIADGAIRSGKTVFMSMSFIMWAMTRFNHENFAMCGKTVGSFRRNVMSVLKMTLPGRGYTVEEHRSENYFIVRKDDKENIFYIFGGRDERSQDLIQGLTLAGVFLDEVALMPESFVNQATGRCSVEGSKYWFNCNPDGQNHWFYIKWVLQARKKGIIRIHFVMDDNPSLSEEIKNRYKAMYTGVFFRRYILGLWVAAEGLVYQMFDKSKHVYCGAQEYDPKCEYYITIDYGTVNPFAALLVCYNPQTKKTKVAKEYYFTGRNGMRMDNEGYYTEVAKLAGVLPIRSIIVDPSAAGFIETIKKHNKYIVIGADNDVLAGIQETGKYFNMGLVSVHDSCKNMIAELQTYAWDEKKSKATGEDAVIKENDHACDALRYFVYTILRRRNRWLI